jgi:hypothetical protein|tara:strand:+ start:6070 stop:6372 length:303 start_codon:yes stop_codon:yes gene_type:complete
MPGFFEALSNMPPVKEMVLKVEIDGKEVEVDKKLHSEILKYGRDSFEIKKGVIVRKPIQKFGKAYELLTKDESGYSFHDGHVYWPDQIIEGGFTWQIESE